MTIVVQSNVMYVRPESGLLVKVGGPASSEERSGRIVEVDSAGVCSVLVDGKNVFHGCKFVQVDVAVENRPAEPYCYAQLLAGYPIVERG